MTVLVDTYEVPAHAIMSQLYKTTCYEVMIEEVLGRSYNAPRDGKKYTVLEDISPKTLISMRDVDSVIYVFHREILSEKEYKIIRYYTNELIYVENNSIRIVNKKTKNKETYEIERTVGTDHRTMHKITKKPEQKEQTAKTQQTETVKTLTEKQERSKEGSLPFLRVQRQEEVYFPEDNEETDEEEEI